MDDSQIWTLHRRAARRSRRLPRHTLTARPVGDAVAVSRLDRARGGRTHHPLHHELGEVDARAGLRSGYPVQRVDAADGTRRPADAGGDHRRAAGDGRGAATPTGYRRRRTLASMRWSHGHGHGGCPLGVERLDARPAAAVAARAVWTTRFSVQLRASGGRAADSRDGVSRSTSTSNLPT